MTEVLSGNQYAPGEVSSNNRKLPARMALSLSACKSAYISMCVDIRGRETIAASEEMMPHRRIE